MVSVHTRTLTLTLTLTHTITAYSVSGNVVRVRILICATIVKSRVEKEFTATLSTVTHGISIKPTRKLCVSPECAKYNTHYELKGLSSADRKVPISEFIFPPTVPFQTVDSTHDPTSTLKPIRSRSFQKPIPYIFEWENYQLACITDVDDAELTA